MGVNRVSGLVIPFLTKYFIDGILYAHRMNLLWPIVCTVFVATAIQGVTSYFNTQLISKAVQRMIAEMRRRVQAHVGRLPIVYYDTIKTGQLVSRIMNDVDGLRNLIGTGMIEFFGNIVTAILAAAWLIHLSAVLTGIVAGMLLVFGFGLRKAFAVLRPFFRARPRIMAEITGRLTESLGGVRVVKGYHAESREEATFSTGVQALLDNVLQSLTTISLMSLFSTLVMGAISGLIMYFGGRLVALGHMTPGGFVSYSAFLAMLVAPVLQIVNIGTQVNDALAGLERTRDILSEPLEESDTRRVINIGPVDGYLQFENVGFAYDSCRPVLNDVSFAALPGSVTALVGPSGAGKSTIISLIASFYTPTSGLILVDGIDLSTVNFSTYRTQTGLVLQETFLFDGTIYENVAFSRPNASQQEVLAACRVARVDEFADQLKMKYDTIIGERGIKLSGGQRQRISIARALLANPRILILDEATSNLDSESEALIQQALVQLLEGRTTFVIAHRLSTIRRADQILVVEAGRVVERGTHSSLYASGGRYFEMYTRQHCLQEDLFLSPRADGMLGRSSTIDRQLSTKTLSIK